MKRRARTCAAHAAWLLEKLQAHGIETTPITTASPQAAVDTFRATKVTFAPEPFEGRTMVTVNGDWQREPRDIPAGSLFVPIAQAKSYLIMQLLEPKAPDSLVSWGFFNAAFERKEYMEAYVAEQVAREMLRKDAAVKREFEQKLASDPEFARSPAARLDFFYRKHASWDERVNLYPIYRTEGLVLQ